MINEEDLKQIVDAVMLRLSSMSKTIDQLAPVEVLDDSAFLELNGGRKIAASVLSENLGKKYLYKYVDTKIINESQQRKDGDTNLSTRITSNSEKIRGVSTRLSTVEVNNVPATESKDGYMTKEKVIELRELVNQYGVTFFSTFVDNVAVEPGQSAGAGVLVFDNQRRIFLKEVNGRYYQSDAKNPLCGTVAKDNKLYIDKDNNLYIGKSGILGKQEINIGVSFEIIE